MSAVLMFALLLQIVAIVLLRHRLGKTWLRYSGTLLVLTSTVYIGVSPALLSIPSIRYWDIYRQGVQQSYADEATLIMAAGMLAFTACYLLAQPQRGNADPAATNIPAAAAALDWRLLGFACAPLAVLTYEDRGYAAVPQGAAAEASPNLATTFLVLLVLLTALAFLLTHGMRWFVPVLAAQSVLLAAAGERTPVITDAVALVVLLLWCGYRPTRQQRRVAAALTLVAILAITGVRVERGRAIYYSDSGLGARVSALAAGITAAGRAAPGSPGLIAQAAVRLDGVDFAAAILQARALGAPRLDAPSVPESLLLAVPSALWRGKLAHAINPAQSELDAFGMQQINFLPGLTGMYAGFLPPLWLIAFLGALGLGPGGTMAAG